MSESVYSSAEKLLQERRLSDKIADKIIDDVSALSRAVREIMKRGESSVSTQLNVLLEAD